jgi:general secretion pathway protein D
LPFLKDIPVLGSLFGTTSNETDRTELLIFPTPHVIHDPEGARTMTDDLLKGLGGFGG